jgi:hypothetical protein
MGQEGQTCDGSLVPFQYPSYGIFQEAKGLQFCYHRLQKNSIHPAKEWECHESSMPEVELAMFQYVSDMFPSNQIPRSRLLPEEVIYVLRAESGRKFHPRLLIEMLFSVLYLSFTSLEIGCSLSIAETREFF